MSIFFLKFCHGFDYFDYFFDYFLTSCLPILSVIIPVISYFVNHSYDYRQFSPITIIN